jgi:hypothetical protein
VAARKYRDQSAFDHALLPENDRPDRRLCGTGMRGRRLGGTHHHVFEFLETFDRHDGSCSCLLLFSYLHRPPSARVPCTRIMQTSRHDYGINAS